jgi:hypothetical protein
MYLMCLGVESFALVLNEMFGILGCQRMWWLGVFIAPNHIVAIDQCCWRWAHRTVRCATGHHCSLSGAPPRQLTVRVRSWSTVGDFVFLRHRTVRCHTEHSGAL